MTALSNEKVREFYFFIKFKGGKYFLHIFTSGVTRKVPKSSGFSSLMSLFRTDRPHLDTECTTAAKQNSSLYQFVSEKATKILRSLIGLSRKICRFLLWKKS